MKKKTLIITTLLFATIFLFGQNTDCDNILKEADSYAQKQEYSKAIGKYHVVVNNCNHKLKRQIHEKLMAIFNHREKADNQTISDRDKKLDRSLRSSALIKVTINNTRTYFIIAYNGFGFGLVDLNGDVVLDYKYDDIQNFYSEQYIRVKLNGTDYVVDVEKGIEYRYADNIDELNENTEFYIHSRYPGAGGFEEDGIQQKILGSTQLKVLSISSSRAKDLPAGIGQLKNLEILKLSARELTTLPPEIGQLKNLKRLKLSTKQLTTLPPEIGQLKDLKRLELSMKQ